MEILDQIEFSAPINSIGLDSEGGRVVAAVGNSDLHLCQFSGRRLDEFQTIPLRPDRYLRRPEDKVHFHDTKVAWFNDALFVARRLDRWMTQPPKEELEFEEAVELVGINLATGQEYGSYYKPGTELLRSELVMIPPHYALLSILKTVLCIDLTTFQEACRVREIDDLGDPAEEDAIPEECVAPNGFAYDPVTGLLYMLCGVFNEAFLSCYQLDLPNLAFSRVYRRSILEGHDPAGLCLNPTGGGVTAALQIMDALVDLRGDRVTDWTRFQQEMLALAKEQEPSMPRTARLGCLGIFNGSDQELIDIYSEIERDFSYSSQVTTDASGQQVVVGYRLSAGTWDGGEFMTRPIYLEDHRLLVGTPNGFLLLVDTQSRELEVAHDFNSPINTLQLHREKGLLLAGCQNGILSVVPV